MTHCSWHMPKAREVINVYHYRTITRLHHVQAIDVQAEDFANAPRQLIPLRLEWRKLARRVGEIFGLDIYGLDVVETSNGPVVVDINDFPSFGHVPGAVSRVSNYILHIAEQAKLKRHGKAMIEATRQRLIAEQAGMAGESE